MFCPECKSEYRDGFTICADCNIPLVDKLPVEIVKEAVPDGIDYEYLTSTYNAMDVALLKSIFDGENIKYYVSDEMAMSYIVAVPARFFIKIDQIEFAKVLVSSLDMNFTVI